MKLYLSEFRTFKVLLNQTQIYPKMCLLSPKPNKSAVPFTGLTKICRSAYRISHTVLSLQVDCYITSVTFYHFATSCFHRTVKSVMLIWRNISAVSLNVRGKFVHCLTYRIRRYTAKQFTTQIRCQSYRCFLT